MRRPAAFALAWTVRPCRNHATARAGARTQDEGTTRPPAMGVSLPAGRPRFQAAAARRLHERGGGERGARARNQPRRAPTVDSRALTLGELADEYLAQHD